MQKIFFNPFYLDGNDTVMSKKKKVLDALNQIMNFCFVTTLF